MPKYAILSHTWSTDEVSFQEVQALSPEERKKLGSDLETEIAPQATPSTGYVKIKHTCQRARREGIKYAWADTCCIDKTSSAELSEAINSMMEWYENSEVCYAYLADVPPGVDLESKESAFVKSRWFTRERTLQELLAPDRLVFLASDWSYLFAPDHFSPSIISITIRSEESCFLIGLEGTEVTTPAQPEFQLSDKTWIIKEKLEEVSCAMHQSDSYIGPGFAAAKFLCYLKGDKSEAPAFLRLYYQIPIIDTECSLPQTRANQAVSTYETVELITLKALMKHSCPVTPRLLGYQQEQQADNGIVPGGFITAFFWEKVPGTPLSEEYFWNLSQAKRDIIRDKFRIGHKELLQCGYQPFPPSPSKLIYDEFSGSIYFSGFRMAVPVKRDYQWSNTYYVPYKLAKAPCRADWFKHEEEWEY
ncbi:hypothetical protein N7488_011665 [Penicillium malachiteum]|nr:hypothetical protein N7488_011665 [Penicillium malachiteum]